MAKRITKKPDDSPNEPEVKPSLGAYLTASWQLAWGWIKTHKLKAIVGVVIFAVVLGGLMYLFRPDPAQMTNDEIVVRVSRELGISGDANPKILTVEDEAKISQPFLEEAKNGDKVLLYYKSGKSVLFRPSENRVVRSGTFTPPAAKVFVRQGTNDDARLQSTKDQIGNITDIELVSEDYSTNRLNEKTIVIDVTDRYPDRVQEIAKALNADIVRLPDGETIPDADILVIVGAQ